MKKEFKEVKFQDGFIVTSCQQIYLSLEIKKKEINHEQTRVNRLLSLRSISGTQQITLSGILQSSLLHREIESQSL